MGMLSTPKTPSTNASAGNVAGSLTPAKSKARTISSRACAEMNRPASVANCPKSDQHDDISVHVMSQLVGQHGLHLVGV